tara:strand:- start:1179 stop:2024 length:846 start_codon:yes stop_codon:yes gene_type:complete
MNKIIIGTANFFNNYGLLNSNVKKYEVLKILKHSKKKKYNYIDTSFAYDDFSKLSNELDFNKFNISSKILLKKKFIKSRNFSKNLDDVIRAKLKKFNIKKFNIFFIHNFDNLNLLEIKRVLIEFNKFKKNKIIKSIGASIYNKNSISKIIKLKEINVVQFPLSIIDRKFLSKKIIMSLKKKKIKIQVRSIFAQGLIFRKNYSKKINKLINEINNFNLEILDVSLAFIKKFKFIDNVVIGVNSLKQLKQIENSFKKTKLNMKKIDSIINKLKQSTFDLRKLN